MAALAPESLVIALLTVVAVVVASAASDGLVDVPPPLEAIKNLDGADGRKLPPWVVIVNICLQPECIGARISRQWVLSEAHCTIGFRAVHLTISNAFIPLASKQVDQVVTHEKYLLDWRYSISALKTKEDMTEGEFIKLPNSAPKVDSKLIVYGWSISTQNKVPMTMEMIVKDFSTCGNFSNSEPNKDLQLCVGTMTVRSCEVSTGGLMVLNNSVLVGIVPLDLENCVTTVLRTSVAGFRQWIKTTTSI